MQCKTRAFCKIFLLFWQYAHNFNQILCAFAIAPCVGARIETFAGGWGLAPRLDCPPRGGMN